MLNNLNRKHIAVGIVLLMVLLSVSVTEEGVILSNPVDTIDHGILTIEKTVITADMEIQRLISALNNERYTITNFNAAYKMTGNTTPFTFNATLLDETATAYDPAVINMQIQNTANKTHWIAGGVFWPFGYIAMHGNTTFPLWSDFYEQGLEAVYGRPVNIPAYNIRLKPAVGLTRPLEPGETISRNYTVITIQPGLKPGEYTATGDFGYHESQLFRNDPKLEWTINMTIAGEPRSS